MKHTELTEFGEKVVRGFAKHKGTPWEPITGGEIKGCFVTAAGTDEYARSVKTISDMLESGRTDYEGVPLPTERMLVLSEGIESVPKDELVLALPKIGKDSLKPGVSLRYCVDQGFVEPIHIEAPTYDERVEALDEALYREIEKCYSKERAFVDGSLKWKVVGLADAASDRAGYPHSLKRGDRIGLSKHYLDKIHELAASRYSLPTGVPHDSVRKEAGWILGDFAEASRTGTIGREGQFRHDFIKVQLYKEIPVHASCLVARLKH